MTAVVIGGTPGSGKTKVAQILGPILSAEVISLGDLAQASGCITKADPLRDTGIIDEECLIHAIEELIESRSRRLVVEGHYIDLVPCSHVEAAIILRTHPAELKRRLMERDYSKEKVDENVEAEVIGVCQLDALEAFGEDKVFEVDTTRAFPADTAAKIADILAGVEHTVRIDWMELLDREGRLNEYLTEDWRADDFD